MSTLHFSLTKYRKHEAKEAKQSQRKWLKGRVRTDAEWGEAWKKKSTLKSNPSHFLLARMSLWFADWI